jgi:hypothetical protein
MRALRELEPPELDEGLAAAEVVAFERVSGVGRPGVFVGAAAVRHGGIDAALADAHPSAPHLLFDWAPDQDPAARAGEAERLRRAIRGPADVAICPHPAGPPSCWCRPPLPGLVLAFARAHSIEPSRSVLIGCSPAHRTLANTLGSRYVGL